MSEIRARIPGAWPPLILSLCAWIAGCGSHSNNSAAVPSNIPSANPVKRQSASVETTIAPGGHWFDDLTAESGIEFTYHNGREGEHLYILETLGGGAAMVDYDLNGSLDLFFTGGGSISAESPPTITGLPSALYRNAGGRRFQNVTIPGGLSAPPDYSQGCTAGDFDADGFADLFVCCYGRSRLYRNQGDGTFSEDSGHTGFPAHDWHSAAVFADIDQDGLPELFVTRYAPWSPETDQVCIKQNRVRDVCGPASYPGTTCRVYWNLGDGNFEDRSDQVGLKGNIRGLQVVATDLNSDGRVDFYVASDESPKHLYVGGPDGTLTEIAETAGAAIGENGRAEGSMGVDVGDCTGDGLPDLFVTNFEAEDNALYRNLGGNLFMHSTISMGLGGASRMRVGWGAAMTDFDGDGWLDLFVLNGNPLYSTGQTPFKQPPQLFRNRNGKRFEQVSAQGGSFFQEAHAGRGLAAGDLDDDGAPDVVAVQVNDPVRILFNRKIPENFVRVELRAVLGEPAATGARITIDYNHQPVVRFATQGSGFLSRFDPRIILPVSKAAAEIQVRVDWPGRATEKFSGLATRKTHLLVEGRGSQVNSQ